MYGAYGSDATREIIKLLWVGMKVEGPGSAGSRFLMNTIQYLSDLHSEGL